MGKVNIKIRRKPITADSLEKYRNYPALLKKYQRDKQFKRALRIFLYSLALTAFILLLVFISMWKIMLDKQSKSSEDIKTLTYGWVRDNQFDTVVCKNFIHLKTDSFYNISYQYDTFQLISKMRLPIRPLFNIPTNQYIFLSEKIVTVNKKEYRIIKYLFDTIGMDEEAFIFYSPDFGILTVRSRSWGRYRHLLMTGNIKNDKIIQQLTRAIENDIHFFKGRTP